jgi:hypothetical protein
MMMIGWKRPPRAWRETRTRAVRVRSSALITSGAAETAVSTSHGARVLAKKISR